MWARVIEFMIACWLSMSPFIFRYTTGHLFFWKSDFISAILIATFSLLSFWFPLRKLHLLNIGVAFWLMGLAYYNFPEMPIPPEENSMCVGFLIAMLAIVPCHSHMPPISWQKFKRK